MTTLEIVKHPNEILETVCEQVTKFDRNLHLLLDDMYKTMLSADGVGLAGPQVGVAKQIAVVDIGDGENPDLIELINPVIIEGTGRQIDLEGCLSIPGVYGKVARAQSIKVHANDRYGNPICLEAEDFLARAIQHEVDHLNGILFLSKIIEFVDESELEWSEEQ